MTDHQQPFCPDRLVELDEVKVSLRNEGDGTVNGKVMPNQKKGKRKGKYIPFSTYLTRIEE